MSESKLQELIGHMEHRGHRGYNYAFLDEDTKREIRRRLLKAVAIPGYQVPFGSREMPLARGWGTGGVQITLSLIGPGDILKVIEEGYDDGVNAVNIKRLIQKTTSVMVTTDTRKATIVQTRHRIPEERMTAQQILVVQVPTPDPLRLIESSEAMSSVMHAEQDYHLLWVYLYEEIARRRGAPPPGSRRPLIVNRRYIMAPSPIPAWDIVKFSMAETLFLFGAGRNKRIYALPPHTIVEPVEFEDFPFTAEDFHGKRCAKCGSTNSYLNELLGADGEPEFTCSDTSFCLKRQSGEITE